MYLTKATPLPPPIFDHFWVFGVFKKGGVKTRKKPVKMSLFSQHPASAKYALKLTEILLYREGGISRYRGGHVAGDFIPRTPKSYEDAMTAETCNVITST